MNVKNRTRQSAAPRSGGRKSRQLALAQVIPVLMVAGISAPLHALELGEVQVQSSLGQPLRASIAFALGRTEELFDFCVSLNGGSAVAELPALSKAKLSISGNQIIVNGSVPIREPLLSMRLTVDCPYTAHLSREYMLFIDPPGVITAAPASATAALAPTVTSKVAGTTTSTPARSRQNAITEAVPMGREYRVRAGDSLSDIVSRIPNRQLALWPAVDAVYRKNLPAFIDGDINRLQAGTVLVIPDFSVLSATNDTAVTAAEPAAAISAETLEYDGYAQAPDLSPVVESPASASNAEASASAVAVLAEVDFSAPVASTATTAPDFADTALEAPAVSAATTKLDRVANARPGDLFVASDIPADAAIAPDKVQDGSARITPVAKSGAATSGSSSNSLAFWIAGTGLALITGLLLFGRRIRERLGSAPAPAADGQGRRRTDLDARAPSHALADLDFELAPPLPGERSIVLDADLGAGTGFNAEANMHVAQDFGYSVDTDNHAALDLEISEPADADETPETDIIPPLRARQDSILESEVPPSLGDDDG